MSATGDDAQLGTRDRLEHRHLVGADESVAVAAQQQRRCPEGAERGALVGAIAEGGDPLHDGLGALAEGDLRGERARLGGGGGGGASRRRRRKPGGRLVRDQRVDASSSDQARGVRALSGERWGVGRRPRRGQQQPRQPGRVPPREHLCHVPTEREADEDRTRDRALVQRRE
jgi:hypothetical protein